MSAPLDPAIVRQIRALRAKGESTRSLSIRFGVSRSTVTRYVGAARETPLHVRLVDLERKVERLEAALEAVGAMGVD